MAMSQWLDSTPPPDVEELTTLELLDLWSKNRNNLISRSAADEVMKRLVNETKKETT